MVFKRVILVDGYDHPAIPRLLIYFQKKINKGKTLTTILTPIDTNTREYYNKLTLESYNRKNEINEGFEKLRYDVALCSSFDFKRFPVQSKVKAINVGYCRGMPSWLNFVKESQENSNYSFLKQKFIFWPLTVISVEKWGFKFDLEKSMLNTMNIIRDELPDIKIIFRLHPTTEKNKFKNILVSSRLKNYEITTVHPQVLINKSIFVFHNASTSIFCDAWFLNKPVVQYTPEPNEAIVMYDKTGNPVKPAYHPVIDFCFWEENKFRKFLRRKDLNNLKMNRKKHLIEKRMPVHSKTLLKEFSSIL